MACDLGTQFSVCQSSQDESWGAGFHTDMQRFGLMEDSASPTHASKPSLMLTILRSVNQVKDHGPWTRAIVSTCHCQSRCLDGSSCAVSKFASVDSTLNHVAKTIEVHCLLALRNHSEDVGRVGSFWVFRTRMGPASPKHLVLLALEDPWTIDGSAWFLPSSGHV